MVIIFIGLYGCDTLAEAQRMEFKNVSPVPCEPNALASGVASGCGPGLLGLAAVCQCPTLARAAHRRDRSFSGFRLSWLKKSKVLLACHLRAGGRFSKNSLNLRYA